MTHQAERDARILTYETESSDGRSVSSESAFDDPAVDATVRAMRALAARQGLRLGEGRGRAVRRARHMRRAAMLLAAGLVAALLVSVLAAGWRVVIVRSGSMGDRAPMGALLLARPQPADAVAVGDMIVMRREGRATVTHEVTDIRAADGELIAITRGRANDADDPLPYALGERTLTVAAVVPVAGHALLFVTANWLGIVLLLVAAYVLVGPERDERPRRPLAPVAV